MESQGVIRLRVECNKWETIESGKGGLLGGDTRGTARLTPLGASLTAYHTATNPTPQDRPASHFTHQQTHHSSHITHHTYHPTHSHRGQSEPAASAVPRPTSVRVLS